MISFLVNWVASSRYSCYSEVGVKLYPISETGSSEDVWGWAPDLEMLEEMLLTPVWLPEPERR